MSIDDKLFEDFFSHIQGACQVKSQRMMTTCSLCGVAGFIDEMTLDTDWGWAHWKCVKGLEKMSRQEQNWNALMDIAGLFGDKK